VDKLEPSYLERRPIAQKFAHRLKEQLEEMLSKEKISLAFPIETRVKEWDSIKSKIERKKLDLKDVIHIDDFIGARIILHFRRDSQRVCELINSTFKILETEDTQNRLGVNQFGYQSVHFQLSLPDDWLKIPTFKGFGEFKVEVQVRTVAQHIWASASHVLQYKQEQGVPPPVLRSINRVSALLETVDLEFERVLLEREDYREVLDINDASASLNVDNIKAIMDSTFPNHASQTAEENAEPLESYDEILRDLRSSEISTVGRLKNLITRHRDDVLEYDKKVVKHLQKYGKPEAGAPGRVSAMFEGFSHEGDSSRLKRGVYCSHSGIISQILERHEKPDR
jgi:putative GTP pyrophosphokinase